MKPTAARGAGGGTVVYLLVAAAAVILLFLFLGRPGLTDPDETAYAESVREMAAGGDYLVPRLFGTPLLDKPILYYWLLAASFHSFGWTETAARLPSALAAIGCLGAVAVLGSRLHGSRRAGWISAIVLASSLEYFLLARAAVTDMLLTFLCTSALLFFFETLEGNARRFYPLLGAACVGCAVLVKGPVGILVPGLTLGSYLVASGSLRRWRELRPLTGSAVFAAVTVPWFVFLERTHPGLVGEFLLQGNLGRFVSAEHRPQPIFYYPVVLIGGFLPWSAWLPSALGDAVARGGTSPSQRRARTLLLCWLLVPLAFFSLAASKLPSYILPILPAVALMVGGTFERRLASPGSRWGRTGPLLLVGLAASVSLLVWRLRALGSLPEGVRPAILAGAIAALIGTIIILFLQRAGRLAPSIALLALGTLALMSGLLWRAAPALTVALGSRSAADTLRPQIHPGDAFLYYRERDHPGLAFYLRQTPTFVDNEAELLSRLSGGGRAWCLMEPHHYDRIQGRLPAGASLRVATKLGDVLVATNVPEGL